MEPTNADIRADFQHHTEENYKFQEETRLTDKSILDSLASIHEKIELINGRLDSIETKMEPMVELYNGFVFGNKALKWLAGVIGAMVVITGAVVAVIKYLE